MAIAEPAAGLDDVLTTEELGRRPARAPDHAAEASALAELTRTLAEDPRGLLQRLAELVLGLCRADSAGVSVYEPSGEGAGVFRWPAVAGAWARYGGASLPRDASPCGVVIDRDAPQLFDRPGRHFPDVAAVTPTLVEALLVPFRVGGTPVGTVWAIAHDDARRFDAEDLRLLTSVSGFAAAAQQTLAALDEARASRAEFERRVEVRTSDLTAFHQALAEREERLQRILASATDYAILTVGPDLAVTSWSPGAEAVFGYAAGEIVGRPVDVLFTPEDRAAGAPAAEVRGALAEGRVDDERWHLRRDGSRFYASGVLSVLGEGAAHGFVKVLRDLTERKRLDDALRDARDRLETRVAERTAELEAEVARRRDLVRQLATAQEDERRRVARDLHDQTGQLLAGLALALEAAAASGPLPPAATARLAEARRVAAELARQVHGMAVSLRPTALDDLGLAAALGELTARWSASAGVPVDFQATGLGGRRLPVEVETVLYRVVQEALTNVAKHAHARQVSVVVSLHDGTAAAAVEDDGAGFDPEAAAPGRLGLLGMRERVALAGGSLDVESAPARGTTVIARVPAAGGPRP